MSMKIKTLVIVSIIIVFLGYKINQLIQPPALPTLEETWWSYGDPSKQDKSIRSFQIKIPDKV